ncbi:hypothetical protein LUZ60_001590 [Juncus effusus]|nr:hypothetical protein LUZ60_001590 [Juncus effusus]
MDSPFSGYFADASKCRSLSIDKKIQIIRELSKFKEAAQDKLQSWSRKDILDILCKDLVKERKFTGLSKQRILDYLFKFTSANKILLEEKSKEPQEDEDQDQEQEQEEEEELDRPVVQPSPAKRQRKSDAPNRLVSPVTKSTNCVSTLTDDNLKVCVNVACRNRYNGSDPFCKRCSCCICYKFDENKDPSLWLFCTSDPPYEGYSCGRSCHIECTLKNGKAGFGTVQNGTKLDGGFFCPFCGKENDLLGCWKKQLNIAKDARRVDVLCYRIHLLNKLTNNSSEKHRELRAIVSIAKEKLEKDVGPIIGSPSMGRGIVNRLQFGSEVQKLCAKGIELVEKSLVISSCSESSPVVGSGAMILHSSSNLSSDSSFIRFPIVASTCLTTVLKLEEITTLPLDLAGFYLWHKKADASEYPTVPTGTICLPNRSLVVTELVPSTNYKFKLVAFNHSKNELNSWEVSETTTCFSKDESKGNEIKKQPSFDFSNPNSSEGGESNNSAAVYADLNKSPERETDSDFEDCENDEMPLAYQLNRSGLDSDPDPDHQLVIKSKESPETEEMNGGVSGSALDEELVPNSVPVPLTGLQKDSPDPRSENESNTPNGNENNNGAIIRLVSTRPVMPVRVLPKPDWEPGSSSTKRVGPVSETGNNYEYCVKVVRRLECEGLIESSFRVKFLTWFSLRATAQERKVVSCFVDTLADDPVSLAGQLSDTFGERIYSKRPPPVSNGFCMQLWH